jgi:tRNA-uridine 2-sulfurtransferase
VCFIPDGDTAGYLAGPAAPAPGPIVDLDGTELGRHDGVWRYTVGQRRGLGLDHHERRFVVDVDAERARVVVGPREALACRWVELTAPTWTTGEVPDGPVRVQVRAHGSTVPGRVVTAGATIRLELDEPVHGLALGQAAVVYDPRTDAVSGAGVWREPSAPRGCRSRPPPIPTS